MTAATFMLSPRSFQPSSQSTSFQYSVIKFHQTFSQLHIYLSSNLAKQKVLLEILPPQQWLLGLQWRKFIILLFYMNTSSSPQSSIIEGYCLGFLEAKREQIILWNKQFPVHKRNLTNIFIFPPKDKRVILGQYKKSKSNWVYDRNRLYPEPEEKSNKGRFKPKTK